jgi:hypothetical protein
MTRPDFWTYLDLYQRGILGPGAVLTLHVFFAYLVSLVFSLGIGLIFLRPPDTRLMLLVCLVPTVTVSPLIVRGLTSNDIDIFEVAFFMMFVIPAIWLLPARKRCMFNSDRAHSPRRVGYATVLFVEGLALLNFVPWFL